VVLTALAGAVGFLTRIPVGQTQAAWDAFRSTPAAFVAAGWLIGGLLVLPLVPVLPVTTAALVFLVWVYVLTGINHLDGVADLGDAMVVHGDQADRREVLTDTVVGVGAVLAVSVVVVGLGLAALAIAGRPRRLLAVVVASEVGAKAGMATLVSVSASTHEGLGSAFTDAAAPRSLAPTALLATPAAALAWPHPAPGVALVTALAAALGVRWWALRRLGGVNGDVFGAANEVSRVLALHAGVVTWTLY